MGEYFPQSLPIFNRIVSDIPENILTHQCAKISCCRRSGRRLVVRWNKPCTMNELMGGWRMRNVIPHRHRLTTTCECCLSVSRWVVIRLSQEEISHDWSRKYQTNNHPVQKDNETFLPKRRNATQRDTTPSFDSFPTLPPPHSRRTNYKSNL